MMALQQMVLYARGVAMCMRRRTFHRQNYRGTCDVTDFGRGVTYALIYTSRHVKMR